MLYPECSGNLGYSTLSSLYTKKSTRSLVFSLCLILPVVCHLISKLITSQCKYLKHGGFFVVIIAFDLHEEMWVYVMNQMVYRCTTLLDGKFCSLHFSCLYNFQWLWPYFKVTLPLKALLLLLDQHHRCHSFQAC